jgi:hypothetical protein
MAVNSSERISKPSQLWLSTTLEIFIHWYVMMKQAPSCCYLQPWLDRVLMVAGGSQITRIAAAFEASPLGEDAAEGQRCGCFAEV